MQLKTILKYLEEQEEILKQESEKTAYDSGKYIGFKDANNFWRGIFETHQLVKRPPKKRKTQPESIAENFEDPSS